MDDTAVMEFEAMFPAIVNSKGYDSSTLPMWWNAAGEYITGGWCISGERLKLARMLMTAHLIHGMLKAGNGDTSSGTVQSATEGSVSVSFNVPTTKNGWEFWLSSSPYGVQLWALLNVVATGGLFIGGLSERKAVRKVGGVFY